jgi:hypothetical protein
MRLFRQAADGVGGLILGIALFLFGLALAAVVVIALVVWIVSFFGHATP